MAKMWRVTVGPAVARLSAGTGTRRRSGIVFGRAPVYLKELTPEIENDPMLVREEVSETEFKHAPAEVAEIPASAEATAEGGTEAAPVKRGRPAKATSKKK